MSRKIVAVTRNSRIITIKKDSPCGNCGGMKTVSVSVPCPECQVYGMGTSAEYILAPRLAALLEEWAAWLYKPPLEDFKSQELSALAYRTGKTLGVIIRRRGPKNE